MKKPEKGKLIVLEGIDGCGKSTIAERLRIDFGYTLYREPGSLESSEKIRELLLSVELSKTAQALLFIAARVEFVNNVLIPTLNRGEDVVLDRYYFSTMAYQHGSLPWDVMNKLHAHMPRPDKVLYFDCPVDVALSRTETDAIIDGKSKAFFEDLRRNYRMVLRGHNVTLINAAQSRKDVYVSVIRELSREDSNFFSKRQRYELTCDA